MVVRECTSEYAPEGLRRTQWHRMGPWNDRLYSSLGRYASSYPNSNTYSYTYCDGNRYSYSNSDSYRHRHSYGNCDAHIDTDSYSNSYVYSNSDTYRDTDATTYGHTDAKFTAAVAHASSKGNTKASSDSASAAVTFADT